jgi:hypothetical protein
LTEAVDVYTRVKAGQITGRAVLVPVPTFGFILLLSADALGPH